MPTSSIQYHNELPLRKRVRHFCNPIHVMCKLHTLGLQIRTANKIASWYETLFFNPFIRKFDAKR